MCFITALWSCKAEEMDPSQSFYYFYVDGKKQKNSENLKKDCDNGPVAPEYAGVCAMSPYGKPTGTGLNLAPGAIQRGADTRDAPN